MYFTKFTFMIHKIFDKLVKSSRKGLVLHGSMEMIIRDDDVLWIAGHVDDL